MKFRFSLGAVLALAILPFLAIASDAAAQAPKNISMTVGVCDPAYGTRCIKPDTNGAIPITGSLTPSGTQDTNLKQVNGATVNVGAGAAGTGTQRVTTSTDSTIGTVTTVTTVGAVTAITNALPAGTNVLGHVINDASSAVIGHVIADTGSTTAATQATAANLNAQVVGTVASGSADSGNPVKVGCVYNSSAPILTTGQRADCQVGLRGSLKMQLQSADGGTGLTFPNQADATALTAAVSTMSATGVYNGTSLDLARSTTGAAAQGNTGLGVMAVEEAGRNFNNITTNATTTVKSGKGFLHTVCVNTKGATANTATIYDNTAGSGTKIGTLDTTAQVGCQTYDIAFQTGLTIVTATGTAGDLTVSYR